MFTENCLIVNIVKSKTPQCFPCLQYLYTDTNLVGIRIHQLKVTSTKRLQRFTSVAEFLSVFSGFEFLIEPYRI